MAKETNNTLLVLSQVYIPDPASVGQHMADAAAELAKRGNRVVVIAAGRGYDDPSVKYKSREVIDGVEIRRTPLSSFGKGSIALRLLGGVSFMLQCIMRGVFVRKLQGIVVSTSPPMCSMAAIVISMIRRVPITYWVMDLNPDQMIALGMARETSMSARVFNWINRRILKRARNVVALDRFMAERLEVKTPVQDRLAVMPPWPHDDHLDVIEHADNPFRKKHNLDGKFVIMYSGNHSIASPLTTILEAAVRLKDNPRSHFMFIGGGLGKKEVEDTIAKHQPGNIVSLPYQPLSEIKYSLSAADIHLVALGNEMVGIIHPCKVYGSMAVSRPILLLGPSPSHIADIIDRFQIGWQVEHGDVDGAVATIERLIATDTKELRTMGERARQAILSSLSKDVLCGRFCDVIEGKADSRQRKSEIERSQC